MIISWSIVNNEIDFIKDVVEYHLNIFDKMYILDTGSLDGTLEWLKEYSEKDSRVILEEHKEKYTPRYDLAWENNPSPFPEVDVRNYALGQVEKLNADWLVQLDGDEVFLPETRKVIEESKNYFIIGHSTINPVEDLNNHPRERRDGLVLYDPHARIWRPNIGIKYFVNPDPKLIGKPYHCIPVLNQRHVYHHPRIRFVDNPLHFHLHWMYGKKVNGFFKDLTNKEIVSKQTINKYSEFLPEIFWDRRKCWAEK